MLMVNHERKMDDTHSAGGFDKPDEEIELLCI